MKKDNYLETLLTLSTASVVVALIWDVKAMIWVALGLGIIGLLVRPLAEWIHRLWMGFAEILGSISSKIMISMVFYVFLTPLAFLYRFFTKDALLLKNPELTVFQERNHRFTKADFEKPW